MVLDQTRSLLPLENHKTVRYPLLGPMIGKKVWGVTSYRRDHDKKPDESRTGHDGNNSFKN